MLNSLKRSLMINGFVSKRSFISLTQEAALPLTPTSTADRNFFLHWLFCKQASSKTATEIPYQDFPAAVDRLIDHLIHLHATISICRIDEVPGSIRNCRLHFAQCRRSLQRNKEPIFLQNLLDAIKQNYRPLFRKDFDLIRFLLWSKDNGFIQQVYTIAADHLPLYLADKKLFQVDAPIQQLCADLNSQHSWAYNLFVSYNPNDALNYRLVSQFRDFIKKYPQSYKNQELSSFQFYTLDEAFPTLKDAANQIHLLPELHQVKRINHSTDWMKKYPIAAFLLDKMNLPNSTKPLKLSSKKICQTLYALSNEELLDFFYPTRAIHNCPATPVKKLTYCIDHQLIFSPAPEKAKTVIADYFAIKKIRNNINHAMPEQTIDLGSICTELQKRLQRMQNVLENKTPSSYQERINAWHLLPKRTPNDRIAACTYYDTFILPISTQRFAKKRKSHLKDFPTVILLIDPIWQPCVFLLCAAKPKQVAVLGLQSHLKHADKVLSYLTSPPIAYEKITIHEDTIFSDVSAAIKLLHTLWGENFLIDISRGSKLMAMAVISAGKDIDATVIYMKTSFSDKSSRPVPGGERFQRLL